MNLVRPRALQIDPKLDGDLQQPCCCLERWSPLRAHKLPTQTARIRAHGNRPCRRRKTTIQRNRTPRKQRGTRIRRTRLRQTPLNASTAYRIGVDDQIQISVWREHDLSLSVVVRPDGVITMPLLNDIQVVGMTPKSWPIR